MKTKETIDAVNEMAGNSYQSLRRLGEINQRALDRMMDKQVSLMNIWMDAGMQQIKLATEAKGLQDLMTGNLSITKTVAEKLMAENRDSLEMAAQTRDELRSWFESGVAEVTDRVTKVAQKAAA
jgi:phasin family protein